MGYSNFNLLSIEIPMRRSLSLQEFTGSRSIQKGFRRTLAGEDQEVCPGPAPVSWPLGVNHIQVLLIR